MKQITLTTPVQWEGVESTSRLRFGDKILSLGSCFSERIGSWLAEHNFEACVNPFGTLYNPLSLAKALNCMSNRDFAFSEECLFAYQGKWHSFMHHSRYSCNDRQETLVRINKDLATGRDHLLNGSWLLLTLGSSYVYRYEKSGEVVANCHKLPEREFKHTRITAQEALKELTQALSVVKQQNPRLKVLITVSPIRYLRYSAQENSRSKAELLLTAGALTQGKMENVHYFPAYEMMMDELRDYRYYADDLIHPSNLAVEIIRQRLLEGWLAPSEIPHLTQIEKQIRQGKHRSIMPQ